MYLNTMPFVFIMQHTRDEIAEDLDVVDADVSKLSDVFISTKVNEGCFFINVSKYPSNEGCFFINVSKYPLAAKSDLAEGTV